MSATELGPGDLAGYRPLREAIATHVAAARAVRCDWRQVIVFSSTQQSLDLAARLLLDPGDSVWMEEPGYPGARAAFTASGARVVPVPVDGMGLSVSAGKTLAPATRLAYVTPSHQFPLGTTLSLARRLELLRWATEHEAWIIEDDYDSEFRYTGRPLASLQGIDGGERVIYAGTFNKIFFPSLRLAFLIVPEALVDSFTAARAATDGAPPTLLQGALADFIASGHLAAHIRRMRELYRSRRDALLDAASEIGRLVALGPADTGLHVVAHLPDGADDRDIARRAHAQGLGAPPLSRYYLGPPSASGLLLGYAHEPPERIRQGIRTLARVLSASRKR
jgi:GntR family transcriptional regulator/MocR family aminotransferase